MNIEILYIEGCPHYEPAVERVKQVLIQEGLPDATVIEVEVPDIDTARRVHFLGSPSIRVNSLDIEPEARSSQQFGFTCRTYGDGCCLSGLPSPELIRSSLRQTKSAAASS